MLDIVNSVVNARMNDISIYFGELMCHGKNENIALAFSPKTKKLKLYYHRDNIKDIDFVKLQTDKEVEIYIMTRLFLLFKSSTDVIEKVKIINSYNQIIPDSYILAMECEYEDKLEFINVSLWLNKERLDTSTPEYKADNFIDLFNIEDNNDNASYPTKLTNLNNNDGVSDNNYLRFYFDLSKYNINIFYDYKYVCRYSVSFNNHILNLNVSTTSPAAVTIVLIDNTNNIMKVINAEHSFIACYLAMLDSNDFTELDKMLFQLLIDNSYELKDNFETTFTYGLMAESFYNLLLNNNINFSTLIDIIYHSQNNVITALKEFDEDTYEHDALKMHMLLVNMFHYLIKDVKSLDNNKSLFKIIK